MSAIEIFEFYFYIIASLVCIYTGWTIYRGMKKLNKVLKQIDNERLKLKGN